MASSFDKDTPVLRLNYGKDPSVRWVLWPVFAWRVVAPVLRDRPLNLFQKAVLGLARARVVRAVDVAERLLIAPDLALLALQELQGMGMLDAGGEPSKRGLKTLDDIELDPPEDARVGHVLSDPFTGKLWPRFLSGDLPVADVELDDHDRVVMLSGSAGDPYKDRTFSIYPGHREGVVQARPGARDVLRAARRHSRQRSLDEVEDDRDVPRLQRVSFVDERPQAYLLALRARRHESGDWLVDDPFGHGEAADLRARIEERLDTHPGLRGWLTPLIGAEGDNPTLAELQREAEWAVEERLTLAIRQHEPVRERLAIMQRALLEASVDDAPMDKWDDVLVKAQRAAERTLHILHGRFQARTPLYGQLAVSDKRFNQALLDKLAAELGYRVPLPDTLSCVRRGKVQDAEQRMSGSLRPLLVLALLSAGRDEAHPLTRAGRAHPDLLDRLDALATARDRAAHDGRTPEPERVNRHVDTTFLLVEQLLLTTR
jgi:hypothetical protein